MPEQVVPGAGRIRRRVNLPAGPPYFAGRRRELAALRADIDRPGLDALSGRPTATCRVLLVAGRPGCGRTALAARLVRSLSARYPDATLYARLTDHLGEPVPAAEAAAALLEELPWAPPPARRAPREDPAAVLRAALAGRRTVLLLDDVTDSAHLLPLLPAGPDCLVVATAAGPLPGIPEVRPCTLGGLDPDDGVDLLSAALGEIRVTVDPSAARMLTDACAGDPAALRLMGGWLASRPGAAVTEAVRALRDEPATPTAGRTPDGTPRTGAEPPEDTGAAHGAARGVADSSGSTGPAYGTPGGRAPERPGVSRGSVPLTGQGVRRVVAGGGPAQAPAGPATRAFRLVNRGFPAATARMLRLLALAPGGHADEQIASALAGVTPQAARETLFDLAAHGLVRPDGDGYRLPGWLAPQLRALALTAERPQDVRVARARMLERTVRLVQSCRLMAEEDPQTLRRKLEDVPPPLRFASRQDAAGWLAARRPHLLDAARIAAADGELDTLARRLIAALVRALDAHDDGAAVTAPVLSALHGLLLDVAERRDLPRDRAAALINLADLDVAAGRVKEAVARYRSALDSARTADDPTTTGRALEALGAAYLELGDPERSADWFGRALALRQTRGELAEVAAVHGRLGEVYRDHRRFTASLREWRAAAAVHRRLRDQAGHATALGEAARTQLLAGRPEEALRGAQDALHWARQAAAPGVESDVLLIMADTLDALGDAGGARLQREAARSLRPARPGP